MALRALMLLFLILFFSRPVLHKSPSFAVSSQESTMIILLDVSASMGAMVSGIQALQSSQDKLRDVIRKIPSSTRLGLVVYSDKVEKEISPTAEHARIITAIGGLKAGSRPTDVLPALELAYDMLANQPGGKKSILIVSDAADHGWKNAFQKSGRWRHYDPEVAAVVWEAVEFTPNAGIHQAFLQLSEEGRLKGKGALHRFESLKEGLHWKLVLNGRVVNQGSVPTGNQQLTEVPLQANLPEGGFYVGELALSPDAVPFDDTYYLAGRIPKGFRLLIVDGESGLAPTDSETYYLRLALESPRDPRLETLKTIRPEQLSAQDLSQYDAIVLANVNDFYGQEDNLIQWVEKGGGLFLSAGPKWGSSAPVPMRIFRSKPIRSVHEELAVPAAQTPLLSKVGDLSSFEWSQILVTRYYPLDQESTFEPILKLENGDSLLARKQQGKGMILYWATSIDRSWTNMPAKPAFAPLTRELIAALADPIGERVALNGYVDEPVKMRMSPGVSRVQVVAPDGASTPVPVNSDGFFVFPSPPVPGLYQVKTGSRETDFAFAINPRQMAQEGNLTRITHSDLKKIFPRSSVEWIESGGKSGEAILFTLRGRDITSLVLALLLLVFMTESLLAFRWGKRVSLVLLTALFPSLLFAGHGNRFVYAQLKHSGAWDPYPQVHQAIFEMIQTMTNIPFAPERKVVALSDPTLFESPFLIVKGNSALQISESEKRHLKQFIDRGGFVFFDDTLADSRGAFGQSVRSLMRDLYPDRPFHRLSADHALYRTFFLLRNVAGRRISERYFEGLDVGGGLGGEGRTAVVYSANDLLGAWMKDHLGQYSFICEPSGEPQRWEAFKLTINLIYFSLTGTYKRDAVHQPFIEMKLGS